MELATQLALQRYARIHELRHFHDCIGTSAGLSLFMLRLSLLQEYLLLQRAFLEGKARLQTPWVSLYGGSDNELDAFLRRFYAAQRAIVAIDGPRVAPLVEGDTDWGEPIVWCAFPAPEVPPDIAGDVDTTPVVVPCFPARLGIDGRRWTQYVPLGFRVLTESNAQILQRELAGSEFGQVMRGAISSSRRSETVSAHEMVRRNSLISYDTVDFLLARLAGTDAKIHPDTLFAFSEGALNRTFAAFDPAGRSVRLSTTPGAAAANLAATLGSDALREGVPLDPNSTIQPDVLRIAKEHLQPKTLLGAPTDAPEWDQQHWHGVLRVLVEHITEAAVLPLLDLKSEPARLRQYASVAGYMQLVSADCLPSPFESDGVNVRAPKSAADAGPLLEAWTKFCFHLWSMEQVVTSGNPTCPRRYGPLREIQNLNMVDEGGTPCQSNIDLDLCGDLSNHGMALPWCMFSFNMDHHAWRAVGRDRGRLLRFWI